MNRNRTALTALAFAALVLSAALAGPMVQTASAQSEDGDSVVDALFSTDEQTGISFNTIKAAVMGWVERNTPVGTDAEKATASEYARNVKQTFNDNSSTIANWTNSRVNATTEQNVARFTFTDEQDGSHYLFIVADVNSTSGDYENPRALNLTEFQNTGYEVDLKYKLTPYASRNADRELRTFITDYAKTGNTPDRAYLAHLAGEYRGQITGSDLPGSNTSGDQSSIFPFTIHAPSHNPTFAEVSA